MNKPQYIIATGDCETDPFETDVIPKPFVWGFYSEAEGYCHFWGLGNTREAQEQSCKEQFVSFLMSLDKPHKIYMHNGGKFDFMFLIPYCDGRMKIVNGRILEMHIGPHCLRDSFAVMPFSLSTYKKDDIDYQKLAFGVRQKNRSEIVHYLRGDCTYLFEMVSAYRKEFGDVLTVGSAAMHALRADHPFDEFTQEQDTFFRRFYYGGRNQCFDAGIIKGDWKVYDKNSMYPDCMRRMSHPVSNSVSESSVLTNETDFVIVDGRNYGGLPSKLQSGFLDFTVESGTFYVSGHELRAALDTGTFEIARIQNAYTFSKRTTFETFVDRWYSARLAMKDAGEKLLALFFKYILNSAYGKFCLNPDNFKDWMITEQGEYLDDSEWNLEIENGEYMLWAKPSPQTRYFNCATGASITGAARSELLRGLASADRPVYCDTDSIICEALRGDIDSKKLGAWKLEATGDEIAIAGKKLYALFDKNEVVMDENNKPKQASKGSRLTAQDIRNVAEGRVVRYVNPVPAFKLDGNHIFINRNIRRTAFNVKPFGE